MKSNTMDSESNAEMVERINNYVEFRAMSKHNNFMALIKRLMRKNKISKRKLAKRLKISRASVNYMINSMSYDKNFSDIIATVYAVVKNADSIKISLGDKINEGD